MCYKIIYILLRLTNYHGNFDLFSIVPTKKKIVLVFVLKLSAIVDEWSLFFNNWQLHFLP